nr:cytoplasmic tRNA 2-thiolation protein 1 [Vulpes vulpes]
MPAPQCSSCHAARAALRRPRSGQALCGACFCTAFEAEVLHTVQAGRLLPPGAVVAVGASGGKDSTVLAHVLRELAPRLGVSLRLVAVDEGIGGYRDAALVVKEPLLGVPWGEELHMEKGTCMPGMGAASF